MRIKSEHRSVTEPKPWKKRTYLSLLLSVNPFSHIVHLKGRSPVWILLCTVSALLTVNALGQRSH